MIFEMIRRGATALVRQSDLADFPQKELPKGFPRQSGLGGFPCIGTAAGLKQVVSPVLFGAAVPAG
ncbi:hypothetical protein BV375_18030 [Nostoc sp. 106C]|nr:hypothetical protein BV375_18030 [Nostoc sp. 106C]